MDNRDSELGGEYWNVNIPEPEWTVQCPSYLANVDHWDRAQLSVRDQDYELMSWEEVKDLIKSNRLESFKRVPSDLRKYRQYIAELKREHGSVMEFILKERVKWSEVMPRGGPFEDPEDLKILFNDWPYGIDKNIVHLVVWTKFGFEEDLHTGDLMPAARQLIDDFVERTFRSEMASDEVAWFKNWTALKSVHSIEHFHVMLYRPNPDFVVRITNGDEPMAAKLQKRRT